jgi:uncharacterized membrane protein
VIVTAERTYSRAIHPLHAVLLAGSTVLFLGAALNDVAYAATYEIQWNNFASWLIVGGLLFSGLALLFTIVDLCRVERRVNGIFAYATVLLATWVVAFFNALMHARDAWASMPTGLVLSVIVVILASTATWLGFNNARIGGHHEAH